MSRRLLYIALVLFFAFSERAHGGNIDTHEGLSHNGVTALLEDWRGYLWVGTFDGLNIYNGNDIKVIRNSADTTVLRNNRVRALYQAADGAIWIGSESGIMIYDSDSNSTKGVSCGVGVFQNDETIRKIAGSTSGDIVALVENGGVAIFSADGTLKSYKREAGATFSDIIEVERDQYLVTSNRGIYLFDSVRQSYRRVVGGQSDVFESIARLSGDRYVVSAAMGVVIIAAHTTLPQVDVAIEQEGLFTAYRYKSVFVDNLGNLWLGTYSDGVAMVEGFESGARELKFISTPQHLRSSCFYQGVNGRLWIGSFNRGVIQYSLNENIFCDISLSLDQQYRTTRLFRVDDRHVAVKADRFGYKKVNVATLQTVDLLPAQLNSIAGSMVSAAASADGSVWVVAGSGGTKGIYKLKGDFVTQYKVTRGSDNLSPGAPKSMIEDASGNVWLVYNKSVFRMRATNLPNALCIEEITLSKSANKAINSRSLYIDPKDNSLWLPTSEVGLYHIANPESMREGLEIKNYQYSPHDPGSIPSNLVTSIVRSRDGVLWVGTEQGGVCRVAEPEMRFDPISPKVGEIANNNVKSMLCDAQNRLWIATNVGVSLYDIAEDKIVNYGQYDGIRSDGMTFFSAKINDATLVFGGNDNSFIIDASSQISDGELPQFHFGEFRLYNDIVEPGQSVGGSTLYSSRLESGDTLELSYDQNVFSIEIDDLHYGDHRNHNIRYRLLPQNSEWITRNSDQSTIAFNGLPHGVYELIVEVSNHYGQWSDAKSLHIIIDPPLWKTWWAYIIYLLLLVAVVWAIIKVFLKIESYKHDMQVEAIERYNMAEKQRYFSNIAHEIKTPLALIVAPVEDLLETFGHDRGVRDKLQRINAQSRKMTHLIDVAQSIQLSDAGLLKLQPSVFKFDSFIENLLVDFKVLADHDKKNIVVNTPQEEVVVNADVSMIEKIANNLINNALKYTSAGDVITICWHADGSDLFFEVSDSGMGISKEDMPHIFQRFYRGVNLSSQAPSGTGIGLSFSMRLAKLHGGDIRVESEQGTGSRFIVKLPVVTDESACEEAVQEHSITENYIYDDAALLDNIQPSGHGDALIYIVEDNSEMRLMLERIIGKFYNVKSFANGVEVLAQMEKRWPDVLLSDVMMPVMDGYELCERVKADIRTCHIPVILLTAFGSNDNKIKGKELGADLYLVKPFYPKYLITCVENTLSGRAKLRDRFKCGIPTTFSDERQTSQDNKFLEKFYSLITENIAVEDLDLDSFARELGVNRTYFYQKIKNLTGQTPFDLLKEVRLVRSAELLLEGAMSIEEVCVNIGFKSRTHFSKLFKDKYGTSPGRYAASIKK